MNGQGHSHKCYSEKHHTSHKKRINNLYNGRKLRQFVVAFCTIQQRVNMVFQFIRETFYEGRLFRLSRCRELEIAHRECMRKLDAARLAFEEEECKRSEEKMSKLRWLKSFKRVSESKISSDSMDRSPPPGSCNKEAHAAYACRAFALGCSPSLDALRACAAKGGAEECVKEQQALSACVNEQTEELEKELQKIIERKKIGGGNEEKGKDR
uniref:Uncharacterized protein n=1 Tax=Corethron hystrix TaxID=216773 RepID=A0A7S1B892_9STRA|mmetsp:Transcript_16651/g.37441  ORF Transcript_16651/g.37441 Transcript_16651/m.37441 type:complete len:211 (+) Transcript_16651:99-731(+)